MSRDEPSYRTIALIVTIVAAAALFALGLVLQLLAYDLNEFYSTSPLPSASQPLFHWFGLRPTTFLLHITFWFWWLFLWALCHTFFYYPDNRSFARVYAYRFLLSCAAVIAYLSIFVVMAALPRVLLLADIREPPAFTKAIPVISWILPVLFVFLLIRWAYQTSTAFTDKNGVFRITHKVDKNKYLDPDSEDS